MTTTTPPEVAVAAAGLRAALEALAAAMTLGDADAVLAAEPALQVAVGRRAQAMTSLASTDCDLVRQDLTGARAALARCRALGAGSALVAGATLEALGRTPPYSRQGAGSSRSLPGRGLKARV